MTADRIPVSLVTGFLGSGKTTLISALLRQPAMSGTAIVVNEIGAIGVDDAIFAQTLAANDVVLLANGCLCCAAGDDLASTVWALSRRPDHPRRVIIETSGLADPAPALRRLMADPRLRQATRLDGLIATIDAVNGLRDLDRQPVAARQCAVADRRVITKVDLADPAAIAGLSERLRLLNPGAPIACVANGAIAADKLFGASLLDQSTGRADPDRWLNLDLYRAGPFRLNADRGFRFDGDAVHNSSVATWLIEEARPVDWQKLSPRLGEIVTRHGDRLLRLKGVLHTAGDPRPLVIHGVQRFFHPPARLDRWTRPPSTSIVAIGDKGAQSAIALIADALAGSSSLEPANPVRQPPVLAHA